MGFELAFRPRSEGLGQTTWVEAAYTTLAQPPLEVLVNEDINSRLRPVLSKRAGLSLALWGEAGVGKSYTVQMLLRELPCQSLSVHATTTLSALAQRLPKAKKLSGWAEQTLQRVQNNDYVEESSLIDALSANLVALAPFVLHLEDIHEVSAERLAFIKQLAQMLQRTKGVGFLVTSRIEPPEPFTAIRRASLTRTESDALLEGEFKASLPRQALEWIYSKASGNPLYTLEYLRFFTRQGNLWNDGVSWHWRKPEGSFVPATVEALIELTLNQVSQDARLEILLQGKSLLPLENSDLLAVLTELNQLDLAEASNRLRQHGVFIHDTFAHPLYRELTLQRLPKLKRQLFARRALDFLQHDPVKAVSFLGDANLPSEEALALLRQAVERSKTNKNDLQTGKLLARMLEYLPQGEGAEIALEAATLLKHVAVAEATRLASLAASLKKEIAPKAILLQAELLAIQGHLQEAETLWQGLESSQSQAAYIAGVVRLRGVAHHYSGVVELFEMYPEHFAQPDAATTHWLVRGLAQLGQLELAQTMIAKASMIAKARSRTEDDKILLLKAQSDVAYTQADFMEMERLEAEIYARAKALGDLRVMDQALFNRALALEGLGRYEERKVSLEEAMRVCQELGDVTAYMIAQRAYGSLLAELGDYDRAEEYLQGARQYLEGIDFFTYLLDCETTLSQFYRESARSYGNVLALKHARAALTCAQRMNNPANVADARCVLALAYLENSQITEAEVQVQAASEALKDLDLEQSRLTLQITEAYLCKSKGQPGKAIALFQAALQDALEHGALLEQQRLGLELDRLNHDVKSAKNRMQWFEERGLINGVNIAKRLFPELVVQEAQSIVLEKSPLRLEVLGTMQLVQNNTAESVRGRKRAELFAVLLEAKLSSRSEVSRLELVDTLYPEEDELKAATNLREMIHVLRERLGTEVIMTTATGYALGNVASDAEAFLNTGDTSLWRGAYLEGTALEQQGTVAESLYLLLYIKAQELLEMNPKETARVTRLLLEYDPYNQAYLTLCLQSLRASNNHKSLTRLYTESRERFVEVGETLPESWQQFLV
jgi:tetratricopeptide (TPR) repeat protein